jgi:nitronate monooxygenase
VERQRNVGTRELDRPGRSPRPATTLGTRSEAMTPLQMLGAELPIIQAPMVGVSTPAMAAAVSNAGGLGSIGVGATDTHGARRMVAAFSERSRRALNVNVFCHEPAKANQVIETNWIEFLRPFFVGLGSEPPTRLQEIYPSFIENDAMLTMLIGIKPRVVSFQFGLPSSTAVRALREAGIVLAATATSLQEGRAAEEAGMHAVVAQGYEAGGHRGVFDPSGEDGCLGTLALTRILVRALGVPVIAAGGIMDGAGITAALRLGASAAQLGTAFVTSDESEADTGYRDALASEAAHHTVMTRAISGRPARCLRNSFTNLATCVPPRKIPSYPIAYDAGTALNAAGKAVNDSGYGAQWAGQGAPLSRPMPAGRLVSILAGEIR